MEDRLHRKPEPWHEHLTAEPLAYRRIRLSHEDWGKGAMGGEHIKRFDDIAAEYDRLRPDYPPECFAALIERAPKAPNLAVDVAAGTGISTRLLLEAAPADWRVAAVEPGSGMREVLSHHFAGNAGAM